MRVVEHAACVVISQFYAEVIGEYVCLECDVAVYHPDLFPWVGVKGGDPRRSVIVQLVGIDEKCVALLHLDIAEGVKRFCLWKEMGAVAVHYHRCLYEADIARHNHERIRLLLVQFVGSVEHHDISARCRLSGQHRRRSDGQGGRRYVSCAPHLLLIQPSYWKSHPRHPSSIRTYVSRILFLSQSCTIFSLAEFSYMSLIC